LPKPIAPTQVLELAARMIPQAAPPQASVLIVDDDPVVLTALSQLLQPWGINAIGLSKPHEFWTVLTQTNPDLLLLDLEMPTFNGIDLCQVVRQDSRYGDLPILVVTAHTDTKSIQQVFEAGADDLIHKPIAGPELITRVTSRIERSRLRQQLDRLRRQQAQDWQHQAKVDPLTQIANRRTFREYLNREWQRLSQEQAPISLILCDVDCFKAYNDRYGHPAGDTCLKRIAFALQDSINPSSDLVARYGGEEFAVILPNTNLNGALRVAERIQQAIQRLQITHPDSSVNPFISLSLGIAGTIPTPPQTIEQLIHTTDQALYAAKKRGRNTYCLYPL
jgi:diguanylate cyclase (GGDEF)-like protein